MLTQTTAHELIDKLAREGKTLRDDDHSFDKTIRLIEYGKWTLVVTTASTMTLFEDGKVVFTIYVRDTAYDVAKILVRAYEQDLDNSVFEYL